MCTVARGCHHTPLRPSSSAPCILHHTGSQCTELLEVAKLCVSVSVWCGLAACPPCANGQGCEVAGDCISKICNGMPNGVCAATPSGASKSPAAKASAVSTQCSDGVKGAGVLGVPAGARTGCVFRNLCHR